VPELVRTGCTIEELPLLARSRWIIVSRCVAPGALRRPMMIRVRISDAGRRAPACREGRTNRRKIVRLALLVLFVFSVLAGVGVGAYWPATNGSAGDGQRYRGGGQGTKKTSPAGAVGTTRRHHAGNRANTRRACVAYH
jgi:hypothetical protein